MAHKLGLIGCGGISSVWIDAVEATSDCHIALTYDVDTEAATRRAAEIGAQPATTLEGLLSSKDIDLVIIGTPTFTHPDLVVQAAEAGKHILCEKPMALNLNDCQRMIDACATGHVKLAIGHSLRFWGAFLKIRDLIKADAIGTPSIGQIHRMGPAKVTPADAEEQNNLAPWRKDTRYSGGNILEGSIHELDFSRAIFGEVASVYCTVSGKETYGAYRSPLVIQAQVAYEAKSAATLRMGGIVAFPCNGTWVGGTKGTLAFDAWNGPVSYHKPDATEPDLISCDPTSAYELELRDLLQAIASDNEPENSGLNGKKNIGLGLAMYHSMAQGQRIDFEDGLPIGVTGDYQYEGPFGIK
jgi:predicted dehydrogenase